MIKTKIRFSFFLICFVFLAVSTAPGEESGSSNARSKFGAGTFRIVKTMRDGNLIDSANAVGAPAYHRHLVRPGATTSYMLRLSNKNASAISVNVEIAGTPDEWAVSVPETNVKLAPKAVNYVKLELTPSAKVPVGAVASIKVAAKASNGESGEIKLEAVTTQKRKIYFISIDSLGPEYLKLNSKGTGPGKDGDWLMPNLRALLGEGVYYPQHKAQLVSATDMNHASYLSGAYTGTLGLYSVQIFMFGFQESGKPKFKSTPLDIMYYGKDGKPVTTIFNVVKDPVYGGNPDAFTAYISGKGWVPEHYRNPVFGLDRVATVEDRPEYVTPYPNPPTQRNLGKKIVGSHFHKIKDSNFYVWEDEYAIDETIEIIDAEDPDVAYILLGGVDMAGHTFGSGIDLNEWDDRNTPDDLFDDISKINKYANREGIINTVKGADKQLGRLIEYLKKRGDYDNSYVVVESDHNMETNYFDGPAVQKILKNINYSPQKDYFLFLASQMGVVFLRRDDPAVAAAIEKELEAYKMKNPLTGKMESPMIVLTREEMRTGIDGATGLTVTRPMQLYSEYYIEHAKKDGLRYPDIFLFPTKYYQFPLVGPGLGNIGLGILPIKIPPVHIFVGGHGSISTQSSLLGIRGPGIAQGVTSDADTLSCDVAPTLYRLEGYKIPESVNGKELPMK